MNTSEVQALFAQTLLGDYEGEDAWEAISALRQNGNLEIFNYAAAWCLTDDPLKRARAATILCQLRRGPPTFDPGEKPEWMFRDESYLLITQMLQNEQDPMVLDSAISALGHLDNAEAVPVILRYQDHHDEKIRFAVASALGHFPNDPRSVRCLVKLTSDAYAGVRDWAVFALGVQGEADSPEIREALLRCLDDASEDVREEAAAGLGKRRDPRLLPTLWTMLGDELNFRAFKAAADLLGLDEDPPEWTAADYKAALASKFRTSD